MIPHLIEDSLPILVGQNMCIDCHELPDSIGAKRMPGEPTPAPKSHYTDLRRNPNTVKKRIIGARYFCVQCHAPQTDAKPLVENTFGR